MTNSAGQTHDDEKVLNCPKCGAVMEKVVFQNIAVDRCTACRGLWFDALEQEHLAAIKGSESIDVGSPRPAGTEAPVPKIVVKCPVCHTPMIRMVDHHHPHLHFESCTVCYGVFFDAGEFRDYKEHSILETFKGWLR
jgi:Zn-finger nucleic acid-binding protein